MTNFIKGENQEISKKKVPKRLKIKQTSPKIKINILN